MAWSMRPSITITKKWRIAVEASNLFDKIYISQCSSETDCFYGLRRNVVMTLTRKF